MLEHIPKVIGEAMQGVRAGMEKVVSRQANFSKSPATIALSSPAFTDGEAMPARFTEDGEKISPPLRWTGVPTEARSVVLIAEDPDAPTPEPLVHVIAWALPAADGALAEAALESPGSRGTGQALGKNSFLKAAYLPPDPPTGHGAHRYVFQLFALDRVLDFADPPGRGAMIDAMQGHVLATGTLIGTYERA